MAWHYKQQGTGRPLILLHGIGMSSNAWKPVMPILAAQRRVIAFDLPGFGRTPPLPAGTPPTAENIIRSLQDSLREMGIDEPVDFAGNSLGGYFAMEAARRGLARSVVALSPGGLWERDASAHVKPLFRIMRKGLQTFPLLGEALVLFPPLRMLLMGLKSAQPLGGDVRLCSLQPPVAEIFRKSRFDTLFKIYPDRAAGLASYAPDCAGVDPWCAAAVIRAGVPSYLRDCVGVDRACSVAAAEAGVPSYIRDCVGVDSACAVAAIQSGRPSYIRDCR